MFANEEHLKIVVESETLEFRRWLFYFAFRYGRLRENEKHLGNERVDFGRFGDDEFKFGWSTSRGCVTLWISHDLMGHYAQTNEWTIYRLFSRDSAMGYPTDYVLFVANWLENMVRECMQNADQVNSLRICESGICNSQVAMHTIFGDVIPVHRLECEKVGDRWLCPKCIERLTLNAPEPKVNDSETNKAKAERAKVTSALRFSILQRDNFTCRSCGRNAREDGAKLHVDHVVAIANGGKTEPDNLHTLCQDCNLGKSDKRVEQMELWK